MRKSTEILIACISLASVLLGIFCVQLWLAYAKKQSEGKESSSVQQLPTPCYTVDSLQIKDFGLNVHYFQQTGNNFGEKLFLFLESHTNLEVSAIAGEVIRLNRGDNSRTEQDYGETIGYFVTFREKK
jgi:hypothetical protein